MDFTEKRDINSKFRWPGKILVQLGSSSFVSKILWLATKVYRSQIFLHSRFSQVILTQIPIETLLFRTRLPTRQDGLKTVMRHILCASHILFSR